MSKAEAGPLRILCVDDDPSIGRLIQGLFPSDQYVVEVTSSASDFLKALSNDPPNLCLLDVELPDGSGIDLLRRLRKTHPNIPALMITGSGSIEHVVEAMKAGAVDYIPKPFDVQRLQISIRNAARLGSQEREITRLRWAVREVYSPERLVGSSEAMERLREMIRRAASSDVTVLVSGENGTGKELVARALHFSGSRAARPFVDVNCAALTETLLESELFGHEQGAFTGAQARRRGKFEQAHGGTLFLDEIGDMPASTQAKMLRVLQERSFQRVGGEEKVVVDVRVACATNRNLEEGVRQGQFRKDLFYRINTFVIEIPPLRERPEDIPTLAAYFLNQVARREKRNVEEIAPEALEALTRHGWPGNIRELEHAVERAVLVCEGTRIEPGHLPPAVLRIVPPEGEPSGLVETVERTERAMILDALRKNGWVQARAARALGITERMICYKMQNLGIEKPRK